MCINDDSEKIGWQWTLRVLAVERYWPAFGDMGVPIDIAASPQRVTRVAQAVARQGLGPWSGLSFRRDVLERLLREMFNIITHQYGKDNARSLCKWARRYFVDSTAVTYWMTVEYALTGKQESIPINVVLHSFTPKHREVIRRILGDKLGESTEQRMEEVLDTIRNVPMSTFERRVLALELSAAHPDDDEYINVEALLSSTMRMHHAYDSWVTLVRQLPNEVVTALEEWVKAR